MSVTCNDLEQPCFEAYQIHITATPNFLARNLSERLGTSVDSSIFAMGGVHALNQGPFDVESRPFGFLWGLSKEEDRLMRDPNGTNATTAVHYMVAHGTGGLMPGSGRSLRLGPNHIGGCFDPQGLAEHSWRLWRDKESDAPFTLFPLASGELLKPSRRRDERFPPQLLKVCDFTLSGLALDKYRSIRYGILHFLYLELGPRWR